MLLSMRAWCLLICAVGLATAGYPVTVDVVNESSCQTTCQCYTMDDPPPPQRPRNYPRPPQPQYYTRYPILDPYMSGGGSGKGYYSSKVGSGKGGSDNGYYSAKGGSRKGGSGKGYYSGKGGSGKGGSGKGGMGKGGMSKGGMGKGGMGKGHRELGYRSEPRVQCTCSCSCAFDGDDYSGHDTYHDDSYCCGYEEVCDYDGYGGMGMYGRDLGGGDYYGGGPRCRVVCAVPCGNPGPVPAPIPRPVPVPQPTRDDPVVRPVPVPVPIPDDPVFRPVFTPI
jgi:hypothetical protein